MAGWKTQTVVADREMHGIGHKLHHFADLREFPNLKTNMHNTCTCMIQTHILFSFETGNKMQHTFTCTSRFENQSTYRVDDAFMP